MHPNFIQYLMATTLTAIQIEWNANSSTATQWCAFSGNDLTNARTKSDECEPRCKDMPNCTHFTWTDFNSGTCWMKTNNVSRSDAFPKFDQGARCGIVVESEVEEQKIVWDENNSAKLCTFSGKDLKNVTSKAGDCGYLCAYTPNCTHFSWTDFKSGTCWMKKGNATQSEAIRKNDQDAICGIVDNISAKRSVTFVNNCNYPIWLNPSPTLKNGIQRVKKDGRAIYYIPASGWNGQLWPKSDCDSNGQNCSVGQAGIAVTKINVTYPAIDEYDDISYKIDLISGYTVSMEIIPVEEKGSCKRLDCELSLNECPEYEPNGDFKLNVLRDNTTVQCMSPCTSYTYPRFAEPNGLDNPVTKRSRYCCGLTSNKHCYNPTSLYSELVDRVCLGGYGYEDNSDGRTIECSNPTNFIVNVC